MGSMKTLAHVLFLPLGALVLGCSAPERAAEPAPPAPEVSTPSGGGASDAPAPAALPEVRFYQIADG